MNKHIIELFIVDKSEIIKLIPLIKSHCKDSVGAIRNKVLHDEPLLICEYTKNPEQLENIYLLAKELIAKGIKIKIIQNARNQTIKEIDINIVRNLLERRTEIEEEAKQIIDLEVGD